MIFLAVTIIVQGFVFLMNAKIMLSEFRLKWVDLFMVFVNVPIVILLTNINQAVSILVIVFLNLFYLFLLTSNVKKSLVLEALIYVINLTADHLSDIILRLSHFNIPYIVSFIMIQALFMPILYLIVRNNKESEFENLVGISKLETSLSVLILIVFGILMTFTEILSGNKLDNLIYNLLILVMASLILLVIHFSRIKDLEKNFDLQKKELQIKNNNRYIHEMEKHYNELRKFRHDYQNTLLSLDEYIRTDDIQGLKKYYNAEIKPISSKMGQEKYKLEDISKVGNKELKSIFFNKLYSAQLEGINVSFESKNEIKNFHTDTLDLAVAMGIILDNAIEETKEQDHGVIQVGIIDVDTEIMIIVQNSVRDNELPVWKMKKAGFSTKGASRGMGLSNLTEIINRNKNLMLETMKVNNNFLQKITIEVGDIKDD